MNHNDPHTSTSLELHASLPPVRLLPDGTLRLSYKTGRNSATLTACSVS